MKDAWKEYKEMVWMPSWKWVTKHWKGYSVFLIICGAAPYVWLYWDRIKTYIKGKFMESGERG